MRSLPLLLAFLLCGSSCTAPVPRGHDTVPADAAFVGLSLEDAMTLAKRHDIPARVASVDGEPRALTLDHRPGRLNFSVTRGTVTHLTRG